MHVTVTIVAGDVARGAVTTVNRCQSRHLHRRDCREW